jgi:cytosine/adenosine deaminase-related metal-dependent hydrolase
VITIIESSWVMPAEAPLVEDGAVAVEGGRIVAAGPACELRLAYPGAPRQRYEGCTLLPGLINAHTHLELSDCSPGDPPADGFSGWLVRMLTRTRLPEQQLQTRSEHGVRTGIAQCLRYGVTTVGDISRQCSLTRPILRDSPLRAVSFGEVMAMAQRRGLLEDRLALAASRACETRRLRIGITPHAPYSVEADGYRRCLAVARQQGMPLSTHLAESAAEAGFLKEHSGPLRELWDAWLTWDEHVPRYDGGPIRYARDLGLLEYPTLLAHVNYIDDEELDVLAGGQASVVYCPRTHRFFGHPPHRFQEMLARGVNVCIGTDSCASSENLDLRADLRLVRQLAPHLPLRLLLQMVTTRPARALGLERLSGDLRAGLTADLLLIAAAPAHVMDESARVAAVYVDGELTPQ